MAWTTPVTDRTSGQSRMTYTDMNRITQNLNYLLQTWLPSKGYSNLSGQAISKTTWTQNDIISLSTWTDIQDLLTSFEEDLGYTPDVGVSTEMTWSNINALEQIALDIYNMAADGFFPADELHPANDLYPHI